METSEKEQLILSTLTAKSIAPILKLDQLSQLTILREWEAQEPGITKNARLPVYVLRHLLLADLLERLEFLKPSQRQAVLAAHKSEILESASAWNMLVFADGNWCTFAGAYGWLDLTTGETVTELPKTPVETIGYNLAVLYERAIAEIKTREKLNARQHPAESVD